MLDLALPETPGTAIVAAHPRLGRIIDAISQVLIDAGRPMQARDVHTRVEALLGEPIRWASVKATLAGNLAGPTPDSSGWHVDATASPLRAPEPERSSDGRDARFAIGGLARTSAETAAARSRLSHKPTGLVEMHSRPRTGLESVPSGSLLPAVRCPTWTDLIPRGRWPLLICTTKMAASGFMRQPPSRATAWDPVLETLARGEREHSLLDGFADQRGLGRPHKPHR